MYKDRKDETEVIYYLDILLDIDVNCIFFNLMQYTKAESLSGCHRKTLVYS